ncbi:MAG: 2-phospho-L-lactate transferase [Anaerolineales bacterium]|nr:2-phospho-L-lactate transferase [Anaerolineales bacterium]
MKVVALAGGVGGAKLADGLAQVLPTEDLTIIVNTGDDFEHFGLSICPDLDTVCYTLAGLANPETGWGQASESWVAIEAAKALGAPGWFNLGDRDLGTHLERTRRLRGGDALSAITADFCRAWGIGPQVLPMSDAPVRTIVQTRDGDELAFQNYFVELRCEPEVRGFRFEGIEAARPAPGAVDALIAADLVVICPSNPWVSVAPILAIDGLRAAVADKPVLAVSPIIGGQAVKGPAAKMFRELGIAPSALAVAQHYGDLLAGFVLDTADAGQAEAVQGLGIMPLATATLMQDTAGRARLAAEVLEFGGYLLTNA